MSLSRAIISVASIFLGLSAASAQEPEKAVSTACSAAQRGTAACPTYTAPATTAVPRAPMDGSLFISSAGVSTPLFNGAVPPNGFMVQANSGVLCVVNDNGPAALPASFPDTNGQAGFLVSTLFTTPPAYRPIGVVSLICSGPIYVPVRGW
jgi:hypothetical protein